MYFKNLLFIGLSVVIGTFNIAIAAEVEMNTNKGLLVIKVDEANAPETAKNFLQYVKDGFYDGLIFHRVIPGFVIQGGGFDKKMNQKETRPPIQNEATFLLKNVAYSLSMARTSDPHSATSQFFINLSDNTNLDFSASSAGYAVFGYIIEGKDIIKDIVTIKTITYKGHQNVPAQRIIIEKATIR